MPYANHEEAMNDGTTAGNTIETGKTANVILTSYEPFMYGPNKDKKMSKHLGRDAETGDEYEFVGFKFHDAWKQLANDIEPGETVVRVQVLDNGTKYPDYELTIVPGTEAKKDEKKTGEAPF